MSTSSIGIVKKQSISFKGEFFLESGRVLLNLTIAYETYGKLNKDKSNAILICHALTGSAHVAGYYKFDKTNPKEFDKSTEGWWEDMVGPGKTFDTNKYFIICSNVIGSCYGSTSPLTIDKLTGQPFGLKFPVITIKDMVKAQRRLISYLGITKLYSVAGGSLGAMQALEWAVTFPNMVEKCCIIAGAMKITPMSLAFNAIAKQAIISDPNFNNGDYYGKQKPIDGLAIARMAGHITYLSDNSFHKKFGRKMSSQESPFALNSAYEVESYLLYNGYKFTERFDPNCYLYMLKAMDTFDISYGYKNDRDALSNITSSLLLVDVSSDFLMPPYQTEEMVELLKTLKKKVQHRTINSSLGHDAFLLEVEKLSEYVKAFLG